MDHLRNGTQKEDSAGPSNEAAEQGVSGGARDPVARGAFQPDGAPSPEAGASRSGGTPSPPLNAESFTRFRRSAMIRYAASPNRCRREMLLEALDIEAQDCSGCDVCGGQAWTEPPEKVVFLKVVRWNRGRFRKGQLARILIGRRTAEIRRSGLVFVRGIGALGGWELEDAEEAISILLQTGDIRYRKWHPEMLYQSCQGRSRVRL